MESKMLLKDPDVQLTDEVIENNLKNIYPVYAEFMDAVTNEPYNLTPQWRYYNDGKAWLCKVVNKKKTVFWLSIWEGHFKVSLFFTEKTRGGIDNLDIDENIKKDFDKASPTGKLIPLILEIDKKSQLKDVLKIVAYKKSLK